ncbi:MAG: hypothetical protein JSS66_16630 [Armatimonadetes bacterium]|nr:hypothetical protein [Armatimonadota bacterium]
MLHLKEHGGAGLGDLVLRACLRDDRFDRQTNDRRGRYLADLVTATEDRQRYVDAVLGFLAKGKVGNLAGPVHDLVYELAIDGHASCADYLRRSWRAWLGRRSRDRYVRGECARYFVKLDGYPAYAEVISWLRANPSVPADIGIHPIGKDVKWHERAVKLRGRIIAEDKAFAMRADFEEIWEEKYGPYKPLLKGGSSLSQVKSRAYPSPHKATEAQKAELRSHIGADLNPYELRWLLRWLTLAQVQLTLAEVRPFIDQYDPAAEGKSQFASPELMLKRGAIIALKNTRATDVRDFALDLIARGDNVSEAIAILEANYEAGDEHLVLALLTANREANEFHGLTTKLLRLAEAIPKGDWTASLLYALEHQWCTFCRGSLGAELIRRRAMTADIACGLAFDAEAEARKLGRKWLKRRGLALP